MRRSGQSLTCSSRYDVSRLPSVGTASASTTCAVDACRSGLFASVLSFALSCSSPSRSACSCSIASSYARSCLRAFASSFSRSVIASACFFTVSIRRSISSTFTPVSWIVWSLIRIVRASACTSSLSCATLRSASTLTAVAALMSSMRRTHGAVPETGKMLAQRR